MFTIHSTLTEEEKWYFDLHGFLVCTECDTEGRD